MSVSSSKAYLEDEVGVDSPAVTIKELEITTSARVTCTVPLEDAESAQADAPSAGPTTQQSVLVEMSMVEYRLLCGSDSSRSQSDFCDCTPVEALQSDSKLTASQSSSWYSFVEAILENGLVAGICIVSAVGVVAALSVVICTCGKKGKEQSPAGGPR